VLATAGAFKPVRDAINQRIIKSVRHKIIRYALVDVFLTQARMDPTTGWGDWSDEVYTIYPDGTSVRDITLHSTNPEQPHEWQESIVVMGPGFSPDNSIDPAGVTLVDAAGQSATYSWKEKTPPAKPGKPAHPSVHVINTKGRSPLYHRECRSGGLGENRGHVRVQRHDQTGRITLESNSNPVCSP